MIVLKCGAKIGSDYEIVIECLLVLKNSNPK